MYLFLNCVYNALSRTKNNPAHARCFTTVGLMLVHRLRLCPSIGSTRGQYLAFAGNSNCSWCQPSKHKTLNLYNICTTLYKCYTNVLCLLGTSLSEERIAIVHAVNFPFCFSGYNQHSPGGPPPRGPPSRGPGPRKGGRGHSERHSVPPDYSSYSSVFTTSESVFSDAKDKRKSRNREKRSKDKDESDFPSVFSEEEKEKKRERRRSRSREKKKKKDKTKERDQSRSKKQDRSSKRDKSERRKESSGKAKEKRKKEKSRSNNNNNILSSSESSLCHLTEQVLLVIDTDDEYTTVSEWHSHQYYMVLDYFFYLS